MVGAGERAAQYLSGQRETGQLLYSDRLARVVTLDCLSVIHAGQQQEHNQSQRAGHIQDDICVSGLRRCCCPREVFLCSLDEHRQRKWAVSGQIDQPFSTA